MLVANSFDLWQKDAFFSAAEEVQESADIMGSVYRMWLKGRKEGLNLEDSNELRRELQIALGTAKWQLEEFERAVRQSHGYRPGENATTRHKQFVDAIEDQISRVEADLREALAEQGNQQLRWVNLDEDECDDLAAFLSGTTDSSQSSNDESVELGSSKSNSPLRNQMRRKDVNLESVAFCESDMPEYAKSCKEVVTINKDSKYVVELESKEIPGTPDEMKCKPERSTDPKRTWSSPNFGAWKIVIADEDQERKTLEAIAESSIKGKGCRSSFWKQKDGEHLQTKGGKSDYLDLRGDNRFTQYLSYSMQLDGDVFLHWQPEMAELQGKSGMIGWGCKVILFTGFMQLKQRRFIPPKSRIPGKGIHPKEFGASTYPFLECDPYRVVFKDVYWDEEPSLMEWQLVHLSLLDGINSTRHNLIIE